MIPGLRFYMLYRGCVCFYHLFNVVIYTVYYVHVYANASQPYQLTDVLFRINSFLSHNVPVFKRQRVAWLDKAHLGCISSAFILSSVAESIEANQCEWAVILPSTTPTSFISNSLANGVTAMSDGGKSDVAARLDKLSYISSY